MFERIYLDGHLIGAAQEPDTFGETGTFTRMCLDLRAIKSAAPIHGGVEDIDFRFLPLEYGDERRKFFLASLRFRLDNDQHMHIEDATAVWLK